jgi:hypothetical protein
VFVDLYEDVLIAHIEYRLLFALFYKSDLKFLHLSCCSFGSGGVRRSGSAWLEGCHGGPALYGAIRSGGGLLHICLQFLDVIPYLG